MIEFVNVTKSYQLEKNEIFNALNNISLKIDNGEIIGIVGYSGAGKSTLVRLINGLIKPSKGYISIDNKDITNLDKRELKLLRHNIGMIFQNYNLFSSLSVLKNVELALKIVNFSNDKNIIKKRAKEVLSLVGLEDKINEYPKNLSGGQKQRVAIARAIANNPKYLLCDEITSALDNKTALEIVLLLKKIKEKTDITIVFISHQLEIVKNLCERIIVMEDGIIVEDTNSVDLFINPKSNAAYNLVGSLIDTSKYSGSYLLKYGNEANKKTIISSAILKYDVLINILEAQTISIGNITIGFLVVDIIGDNTEEVIKYLESMKVLVNKIWVMR